MLTYNPDKWNEGYVRRGNNCYNYAINLLDNNYRQPGTIHDGGYDFDYNYHNYGDDAADEVRRAALDDGLREVPADGNIPAGWHLVYFAVSNVDYHWFRQDADGTWSHKRGGGYATNLGYDGEPITNPEVEADYVGYPIYGGYLIAPDEWMQTEDEVTFVPASIDEDELELALF